MTEFEHSLFRCIEVESRIEKERAANFSLFEKVCESVGASIVDIDCSSSIPEVHVNRGIRNIADYLCVTDVKTERVEYGNIFPYKRVFCYEGVMFFELIKLSEISEEELNEAL